MADKRSVQGRREGGNRHVSELGYSQIGDEDEASLSLQAADGRFGSMQEAIPRAGRSLALIRGE